MRRRCSHIINEEALQKASSVGGGLRIPVSRPIVDEQLFACGSEKGSPIIWAALHVYLTSTSQNLCPWLKATCGAFFGTLARRLLAGRTLAEASGPVQPAF